MMNSLHNGILIQLGFLDPQLNVPAWPCFNTSLVHAEQWLQHQHLCNNFKGESQSLCNVVMIYERTPRNIGLVSHNSINQKYTTLMLLNLLYRTMTWQIHTCTCQSHSGLLYDYVCTTLYIKFINLCQVFSTYCG